jgi:hypothetical protein
MRVDDVVSTLKTLVIRQSKQTSTIGVDTALFVFEFKYIDSSRYIVCRCVVCCLRPVV